MGESKPPVDRGKVVRLHRAQRQHRAKAMDILGHWQIGATMNTYTHLPGELTRNAGRQLDA